MINSDYVNAPMAKRPSAATYQSIIRSATAGFAANNFYADGTTFSTNRCKSEGVVLPATTSS